MKRAVRLAGLVTAATLIPGLMLPAGSTVPVRDATPRDWNPQSFWFEPWGASGVHKGIDIFAPRGREVMAATAGLVVFRGEFGPGGRVVAVLGPKWRLHYYAHLHQWRVGRFGLVSRGDLIGTVGQSGNAAGKPAHLHYSVLSLLPLPWKVTTQTQGWKRAFYLDPAATFDI